MILFGCLLALGAAVAPRVILILAWLFSDRWDRVWQGDLLLPILGIVFLPYTTIMYMLSVVVLPGGGTTIEGFGWIWIILGVMLDIMKWGQMIANRKEGQAQAQKYYPSGAPKAPTGTSSSATAGTSAASASSPSVALDKATTTSTEAASDTAPVAAAAAGDDKQELDELEQMHKSGTLTDDEYAAAKAKLQS